MKTATEIRDWLLENAVDGDGDLVIGGLDFSEFDGNVYVGHMKVKGSLIQSGQEVQGYLYQHEHKVQGSLFQYGHDVKGDLDQSEQEVQGDLYDKNNK